MIDLKQLREDAQKTQQEMADYLNISQPQYGRYEKDPASMPLEVFMKLTPFLGDMNQIITARSQDPKPLDAGAPYGPLFRQRDLVLEHLEGLKRLESEDTPPPFRYDRLKEVILQTARKPNLALMGRFDAGKTHMINTLLGRKIFVTKFRPTTSLITTISHIDDRPSDILETVEIMDSEGKTLLRGNLGILNEFGVHRREKNEEYERIHEVAYTARVYLDAPILKSCNIIDVPGYQSLYEEDREKANSIIPMIDVLVYLTPVISGLDANDMIELSYLLRTLPTPEACWRGMPPLSNFFLVFTHADPSKQDTELAALIADATHDLASRFEESIFSQRLVKSGLATQDLIKQRSFVFWSELKERREPLFDAIRKLLAESMPIAINHKTTQLIETLRTEGVATFSLQAEKWRALIEQRDSAKKTNEALIASNHARLTQYEAGRDKVKAIITASKHQAITTYNNEYDRLMTVDGLVTFISEHYNDPKRAQAEGPSLLNEHLMRLIESVIVKNMKPVAQSLEEFLIESSASMESISNEGEIAVPLDTRAVFWGGVGSTAVGGGLAIAAASAGNLGGYILASQGVGLLSSAGIGFGATGGTAGVMSAVAAIGGPLTIGIALTALAGLSTWRLLSDSWQHRFAKKLSKHYADNNMREQTNKIIATYFNGLADDFETRLIDIQNQQDAHMKMQCNINKDTPSRKELESNTKIANYSRDLLEEIEWSRC